MKNLKIGTKICIAFIVLLLFSSISSLNGIQELRKSKQLNQDLFNGPYVITREAMGLRRDLSNISRNINNEFLENDHEKYRSEILNDFDTAYKRIDLIKERFSTEDALINELENQISTLNQEYEKIYSIVSQEGFTGTLFDIDTSMYSDTFNKCLDNAIKLSEVADTMGVTFETDVNMTLTSALFISITVGLITILVGIGIGIYITRSIKKPINEITIAANKMVKGDYNINIEYESKDELGYLCECMRSMTIKTNEVIMDVTDILNEISSCNFDVEPSVTYEGVFKNIENSLNKITHDLNHTILQITASSREVESASEQVASASQMLSQGSTEQASAVEELSATVMEISEKVKSTSESAQEANKLSVIAGKEVHDGNEQMKEMIKAMDEISVASNEISKILKTIEDIAFQTNVLALNAAVEAARAGTVGKGFAVVADEVRNLATKASEAVKNTSVLIENSINAVNNGNDIVNNTAQSLQKIIETTSDTIMLVDGIAKSSDEQSSAITQVSLGISQISDVVQTNSATAEESAAASEELNVQAEMLQELIERFNLKNENSSSNNLSFNKNLI